MERCSISGCERPLKYRLLRLCQLHYNRHKRLSQTELPPKSRFKKNQKCLKCDNLVGLKGAKGMCSYHHKLSLKSN